MYQKNNFSSYFVLAAILAYVINLTFNIWRWSQYQGYSTLAFDLQFAALGAYSLFCENEFLNTSLYYQVFIISLISSYRCIASIGVYIPNRYNTYFLSLGVVWNLLALVIHYKFSNFLVYILRYEIGFTIFSILINYIPILDYLNDVAAAGLALGFVFISYLNFFRISNLTSSLLFAYMVENGIRNMLSYIPYEIRAYMDLVNFNLLTGVFLIAGVYYRYKKNNIQGVILGMNCNGKY
jgi:hypothetical protein